MVEHEVERYEDKAPEQQLAFHDPYAFEVGFDGLFLVEEEPCGDEEDDDDADLAAALYHELEEDASRPQGEFQHVVAVVDDEVVHENHEHRDDAQQLDAGIPLPPPICDSGMCRCAVFGVYAVVVLRVLVLFVHNSPLVCGLSSLRILRSQTDRMPHPISPVTNLIQENVTSPSGHGHRDRG